METDEDFLLNKGAQKVLTNLSDELAMLLTLYTEEMAKHDLTKAQSIAAVAHVVIYFAAASSVLNRVQNLGGKPNIKRWREVSDEAFNSAVENLKMNETGKV